MRGHGFNGFIFKKINENENIKEKKISWEPFRICLLNSTANFHPNWAGLAVLISRQLLKGSQDFFFHFNIFIFIYFFRYETIVLFALQFSLLIIFGISKSICGTSSNFQKLVFANFSLVCTAPLWCVL